MGALMPTPEASGTFAVCRFQPPATPEAGLEPLDGVRLESRGHRYTLLHQSSPRARSARCA